MSILKSIKEWLFPPIVLHDPFGEYVKRKQEKIKNGEYLVDKINPQDIQKYFKEAGFIMTEPCKEITRGEIALPGYRTKEKCKMSSNNYNEAGDPIKQQGLTDNIDESYKDLLYKFDPKDVDNPNIVITRGSKEARDRIAKRDLEFCKDKLPYIQKHLKEAGYTITEEIKSKMNDREFPSKRTINKLVGREDNMSSYKYKEAGDNIKVEVKPAANITSSQSAIGYTREHEKGYWVSAVEAGYNLEAEKLVKQLNELKEENFNLKQEVDYYKKYIDWLNENYAFILKSKNPKEIFDIMVGDKNE